MNSSSKINEFIKGSSILIVSNIILKAINFFLLPLYTKYLSPSELGISDTITNITSFLLPILVLAFDSAFSAFYYEQSDEEYKTKIFNTVFWVMFFQGFIPIILMFFSEQLSLVIFHNNSFDTAIKIALLSIVASLWFLPFSLLTRIQNKMKLFALINISASLLMIMLNIFFVVQLKLGGYSLIVSSAIVQVVQLIMYLFFTKVKINIRFLNKPLLKTLFLYALPLVPTTVATWLLTLSDRYVILMYQGESAVGIYGVGTRFVMVLSVIISGITTAYTTFAFGNVKNPNAKKQFVQVLNIIFVILLGVCFTISLFAKEIVSLMVDERYHSVYLLIANLLFAQVIYGVNTLVGYGIAFTKKSVFYLISVSAAALLNIILNFIFVPQYGIFAAAATTFVGYIVMFAITYIATQKFYPCEYNIVKMVSLFLVSYVISNVMVNQSIYLKCGIWCLIIIVIVIFYFDTFKQIGNYLKALLKKRV